ncbi:acyltransferase [Brevundimonas sp. 2R-24]|uniref:Acyltransferase n=1 Tax=Peiella sedimenti TaxID=3061083 RepID=A0ABT8SL11_9CAUL|nr:acyltransferase [Caulobacteraceae bacterium XZ-24]
MTPPPLDLKPLTSLRFLAALWVVMFHYWPRLDVGFTPNLVSKGYLGVELFFVLSGFILCHVYLNAFGEGRFRWKSFIWARIARVYPLHLATLIGVGLLGAGALMAGFNIDANILDWASLPANLLMVHAWGLAPQAAWNHPSWSISAEWFAYLTFPVFAFAAWRLRERPGLALSLSAAALMALYAVFEALAGFSLTQATIFWGALRIVPCFALGCATWLAWRAGGLSRPLLSALACLVAILISASAQVWDGFIVLAFAGLILSLAGLTNRGGWLESRPAVWLGEASYALYMVCVPWKLLAVNAAGRLTGSEQLPLAVWLAVVLMLIPISGLAHHLIERPAREWLRRREPSSLRHKAQLPAA